MTQTHGSAPAHDRHPRMAVVQMNSGDDVAHNLASARRLLHMARAEGAQLAVLPENFAFMGRYEQDKLAIAEAPGEGPLQGFLTDIARETGMWIVGGTVPLRAPGESTRVLAASLVVAPDGALRARYDKLHLFDVDVGGGERAYRESASIVPGELREVCVDTPLGRGGLSVCYDLRFPELYRRLATAGAQWLTVPSAFTARTGQAHWLPLLQARAIENQCFVLAANQCGVHPSPPEAPRYTWGHSVIIDPWGERLAGCGDGPGIAVAELDQAAQQNLRRRFPVLEHRRWKE